MALISLSTKVYHYIKWLYALKQVPIRPYVLHSIFTAPTNVLTSINDFFSSIPTTQVDLDNASSCPAFLDASSNISLLFDHDWIKLISDSCIYSDVLITITVDHSGTFYLKDLCASANVDKSKIIIVVRSRVCATIIVDNYISVFPVTISNINVTLEHSANLIWVVDTDISNTCIVLYQFNVSEYAYLSIIPALRVSASCAISYYIKLSHNSSYARVQGAYWVYQSGYLLLHTEQHHVSHHTTSNVSLYGCIQDKAAVWYDGSIIIDHQAFESNAHQENKNILLSDVARARSVPRLQVNTDSVQCGHGSAVGPLDADMLWLANARGISPDVARTMLLEGFITEPFLDLPSLLTQPLIQNLLKGFL